MNLLCRNTDRWAEKLLFQKQPKRNIAENELEKYRAETTGIITSFRFIYKSTYKIEYKTPLMTQYITDTKIPHILNVKMVQKVALEKNLK